MWIFKYYSLVEAVLGYYLNVILLRLFFAVRLSTYCDVAVFNPVAEGCGFSVLDRMHCTTVLRFLCLLLLDDPGLTIANNVALKIFVPVI